MKLENTLMTFDNRIVRGAALVVLFAFLALTVGAPVRAAGSGDADLRELSRYQLTLADVRKYAAANATLAKQPKVEENEDDADEDDSDNGGESLDEMAARIERMPEARKAIEGAGLSVRQFAVITMALFQASMAQFAIAQGADPAKVAKDAQVNPANIRFVQENKAELEKLKPQRGED